MGVSGGCMISGVWGFDGWYMNVQRGEGDVDGLDEIELLWSF